MIGENKDICYFKYVELIGAVWQVLFFVKNLLTGSGYNGGIRVLANYVGTKDTILADFSREPGEEGNKWLQPGATNAWGETDSLKLTCPDPNLQIEYRLALSNLGEAESYQLIIDLGTKLGLAYNHNSLPRCFNYNTTIFPWTQYFNEAN